MWWILLLFFPQGQAPKRPVEIEALVDRARALPPEFSADIQLRLAASPLIPETRWKRELIEDAFVIGAQAPLPYQQRGDAYTDSRPTVEVAHNDLEALTLQTRAVDAMLPIDSQRGLALFERIVPPQPADVPCTEIITPIVSAYYETAAKVFERSFTNGQREKGDDLHFLKMRIARMQSPAQVVPTLQMIRSVKVADASRKDLMAAFAVALDQVSGSDRLFGTTEGDILPQTPPGMDPALLFPALRSYIVRHASGPRCSDRMNPNNRPFVAVITFNLIVAAMKARSGEQYKPITPEESKPLRDDGTYPDRRFWRSARSKQVLAGLQWLNHGNRDLPGDQRFWKPEERATLEWNQHYLDLLKVIEGWKEEEEETPQDYLWMVAHTYATLADLVPPGTPRENAMGQYLNFLDTHYTATANRNLWFSLVRQMLERAQQQKVPNDRNWILDRLERSKNPIISLYAVIDRRLGRK